MVADGLVAWLIALVGDAGRRKLTELVVGSEVERALASASDAAIRRAAAELASARGEDADVVARVIGERFTPPGLGGVSAEGGTLLEAIRSGITAQIAVLGDRSVTGTGVSSADALGVGWEEIDEAISAQLISEMLRAAASGGPLAALANQLNHDVTHLQNERAAGRLDSLSAGLAAVLDAIADLRDALAPVLWPERLPGSGALRLAATPPSARKIEVARARRAAEALAPQVLMGRTSELAGLADLAGSAAQWIWVQGPAFAGKTALLAWFALHPPDGVDVVACFLRRTTGDNSADYALDVLARQVALIAGRRGYVPSPFLPERANDFLDLLDDAARICAAGGRKLLVLIDGLDEYDPAPSSLDLAAWLPDARTLPDGAILVAASRAGADAGIAPAHPLRRHAHVITASDAATEVRDAARSELKQALTAPGGFIFPLVCSLAVAGSGLTASELASLLYRRGRDADVSEIEAVLGSALGRSLMRIPDPDGLGLLVHVFAHESLLTEARALLAADLAAYEDLLDSWANDYARRNWPVDTPRYLLRPYTRELDRRARDSATGDLRCRAAVDQLFMVVTRDARSRRLFERTGNPAVPFREVVAAQHAISQTRDRSGLDADEVMFRLAVLALGRRPVTGAGAEVAAEIAAVWARMGRIYPAIDLAAGIDVKERRADALAGVAVALAYAGLAEPSLQAAAEVDVPRRQEDAFAGVAVMLASDGQAGPAMQAAAAIHDAELLAETLSGMVVAFSRAGRADEASDVTGQAMLAAIDMKNMQRQADALCEMAMALAGAGQAEPALGAAAEIHEPQRRAEAVSKVTAALAGVGRAEQAQRAAAEIQDPVWRIDALAGIARSLAGTGDVGEAADAAGRALRAMADVYVPWQRADAQTKVAAALAAAGQFGPALQVIGELVPWRRADALSGMATALAATGQAEPALQVASRIHDPERLTNTLAAVALALADFGDLGRASDAARQALSRAETVSDPERRVGVLCSVTAVLGRAGEATQATDAARQAVQAANQIEDPACGADTVCGLAVAFAAAGLADQATHAAADIDEPESRADVLVRVAAALARAGKTDQAAEAAGQAADIANAIDKFGRRAGVLCKVAAALAAAGHAERAAAAAGLALSVAADSHYPWWWQAYSINNVAWALPGEAETIDDAEQALRAASDIQNPERRVDTLRGVASALAKAGQPARAVETASQAMQVIGEISSPWQRTDAVITIATTLAESGRPGRALQVSADIKETWQRADALINVAAAVAEVGGPDSAVEAAAGISDLGKRAEALGGVAIALAGAGFTETAQDAALRIDDPERRATVLTAVAAALARTGRGEQASEAVRQALLAVKDIDEARRREVTLHGMEQTLTGTGQAQQVAEASLMAEDWRQSILAAFEEGEHSAEPPCDGTDGLREQAAVAKLARGGRYGDAWRTANQIADPQQRAVALRKVRRMLGKNWQPEQVPADTKHLKQQAEPPGQGAATLATVAVALARSGKSTQALQAVTGLQNPQLHADARSNVAVALARAGRGEQARQVVADVETWPHARDTPRRVALALARAGQAEHALTAVATIRSRHPHAEALDAEALGTVAVALAATGNLRDALRSVISNDDARQRDRDLLDLLPSALSRPSDHESRQVLELVLFMPNAAKYLPAFPIALQERLVQHGRNDRSSLGQLTRRQSAHSDLPSLIGRSQITRIFRSTPADACVAPRLRR